MESRERRKCGDWIRGADQGETSQWEPNHKSFEKTVSQRILNFNWCLSWLHSFLPEQHANSASRNAIRVWCVTINVFFIHLCVLSLFFFLTDRCHTFGAHPDEHEWQENECKHSQQQTQCDQNVQLINVERHVTLVPRRTGRIKVFAWSICRIFDAIARHSRKIVLNSCVAVKIDVARVRCTKICKGVSC